MVKRQELLEDLKKRIKDSLDSLTKFSKTEKFTNGELEDGTKITTTDPDFKEGSEVFVLDDSGNQTPLEDNTYQLKDGRSIVVKDGKVETISAPAETQDEKKTESPATVDSTQSKQKLDNAVPDGASNGDGKAETETGDGETDLKTRIENLEKQMADILNVLNKLTESTQTQNSVNETLMSKIKQTFSKVKELGDEPGDKPIEKNPVPFTGFSKEKQKNLKSEEAWAEYEKFKNRLTLSKK